ncbi:MAG: hypothetical protein HC877_14380, partial [Thioploca sp.]|nr:hypothetical protein [Thioploca sp.]
KIRRHGNSSAGKSRCEIVRGRTAQARGRPRKGEARPAKAPTVLEQQQHQS